ncbi:hypothetical protein BKA64DRAFT_713582 [Cadophora sp. MPI-SDFR-AT-0126]|nr:hypothetical protein BKA64DRAFT_713582 [Leotiomycetes sp. MPI-SDFR-AT-0126]
MGKSDSKLESKASFLGLPVELRCQIFKQAVASYEIENSFLPLGSSAIWKTDRLTIRQQDVNFFRAWKHGSFRPQIEILFVDMNYDSSEGEDKWSIIKHDIWKKLLPRPSLNLIDLLIHGKLECITKDGVFQRIWYPTTSCFSCGKCEACAPKMPFMRWKNVNKVSGRWRELVNIDLDRQLSNDAAKSRDWCETNGVKWEGPDELEEYDDFSSEDDEQNPEDIQELGPIFTLLKRQVSIAKTSNKGSDH